MKTVILSLLLLVSIHVNVQAGPGEELIYLIRGPRVKTANPPLLVLLHGMGSNEKDLFSFASQIPENFLVVSLRAPYEIGRDSYVWYETEFSGDKRIVNKIQAEKSRQDILLFIGHLQEEYPFDETNVYVCGFSQGGIMSYTLGLTRPDMIKGMAVMSGRLLEEIKPLVVSAEKLESLKIFIAHGMNDEMINIAKAREAVAYLNAKKLTVDYKEYNEAHTISKEMLQDLLRWLNGQISQKDRY